MPKGHIFKSAARPLAIAALLCGAAFSFNTSSQVSAQSDVSTGGIEFVTSALPNAAPEPAVEQAVVAFIRGMAERDVDTVWMFATEEDQDAFGTEQAVYDAFAEVFPAFTQADKVTFERSWQEGETPFVTLALTDGEGVRHRATMGFWLDDAGDWELISCQVDVADDRIARAPDHAAGGAS